MKRNIVSSNHLLGEAVHTQDLKLTGQIEDILLDVQNGRIGFAIVSFQGLARRGEKLIAVPWEIVHMDLAQGGDGFILEIDRERLMSAPAIEKSNLPNFADPQFTLGVYRHYGVHPYWESSSSIQ